MGQILKLLDHNPLQDQEELKWFTKLTMDLGVRRYLEIGSDFGCSMYAVLANSPASSLGVSIDLQHNNFNTVKEELTTLGYSIHTYTGDSKDVSIIDSVRKLAPYDLILIDGDHTYDGLKSDFDNYHNLAPVVAIHDTALLSSQPDVHRFWEEVRIPHRSLEYSSPFSRLGYGVLFNAPWI